MWPTPDFLKMLVPYHYQHHRVNTGDNQIPTLVIEEPPHPRRQCHQEQSPYCEHQVTNQTETKQELH